MTNSDLRCDRNGERGTGHDEPRARRGQLKSSQNQSSKKVEASPRPLPIMSDAPPTRNKVTTYYKLRQDAYSSAILRKHGVASEITCSRGLGEAADIVVEWVYPERIPSYITGEERAKMATRIATWYASMGYACPKIIEQDLPKKAITLERDIYMCHGPIFSKMDMRRYEEFTVSRSEGTSYKQRADAEWDIYRQWPTACLHGKKVAWIKTRKVPPRYDYDPKTAQGGIFSNLPVPWGSRKRAPVSPADGSH